MFGTSPVLIAGAVALTFTVIGAIVFMVRNYRTFHGYREIAGETKAIAMQLGGEVFRDGDDLVVSGEYKSIPTLLRFSNSDNTPAVMLEVRVPSSLDLSLIPNQFPDNRVGTKLKLSGRLEQRFVGRSRSVPEAELLLSQRGTLNILMQLSCSQKTMLDIAPGRLQIFEMVLPSSPSRHIMEHLADIHDLAQIMQKMPGSHEIKIKAIPRERSSWPFRAAVAAGVVIAALTVVAATHEHQKAVSAIIVDSPAVHGILRADVGVIPFADKWHVAHSDDDPSFAEFLRGVGTYPTYPLTFDADGTGHNSGSAYLLTNDSGQKRLVILHDHHPVFDASYPEAAGLVRVPAASVAKVNWPQGSKPHEQISGDALLFVRKSDDPRSAVILYLQSGTLQSAAPGDYRSIYL